MSRARPAAAAVITGVLQVILNSIDHGMNAAAAVAAPRIHHQWLPDEVRFENGFVPEVLEQLRARGHKVVAPLAQTYRQHHRDHGGQLAGAPDPRTRGAFAAVH